MIHFVTGVHNDAAGNPDFVLGLTLDYQPEDGQWVGVCVELGTAAFADTPEQVDLELREAVELQLNEMERLGYLHEYLEGQGVSIISVKPAADPVAGFKLAEPYIPIETAAPLQAEFDLAAR